ncbi:MAG: hypothetical protein KGL10_00125 [Alphaproteobacteria bacterium]|nr:hypothetical protein [Alphaproteobacteria bacterium]MDE2335697.1 hypothetical protein [Alphaproteobacteria bacterium]
MKKPSHTKPKQHDAKPCDLQKMTFAGYLQTLFGETTAQNVLEVFDKLGLAAPRNGTEFLAGAEGGLVFLNQYGLVMRIEHADPENGRFGWSRVDDSGWVLRPIAGIEAGHAHIELCPGCNLEKDETKITYLRERLHEQQIDFWDRWLVNIGRVPVCTEQFPDGLPVVIDRLAVSALTDDVNPVAKALEKEAHQAAEVQETLYAPLRKALEAAWPDKAGRSDAEKMKAFWQMCEQYVAEGKMVAGWNQARRGAYYKTDIVMDAAETYEKRLRRIAGNDSSDGALSGKFRQKARTREPHDKPSKGGKATTKNTNGGQRFKP